MALRTVARWYKIRTFPSEFEDLAMYLALVSFINTVALYLTTIPTYFNVEAIVAGKMAIYASLEKDLVVMLKEFFVVQFFFWLTLWAVKWSLLFLFRMLTDRLPIYNRVWWVVIVFSVLTFIGCAVSNFTACSSMHAWFDALACQTPRDARAKAISLWFSLGADLATDLLIMLIPVRVLWTLKISTVEKFSAAFVFGVGILTMITAIIRSVSLVSSTSAGQVSTTWLMMWAAIEGAVAIVVGCLPSFAIIIKGRVAASRAHNDGSSPTPRNMTFFSARSRPRSPFSSTQPSDWQTNDTASDKGLVGGRIVVTQHRNHSWHTIEEQQRWGDGIREAHELQTLPV
ncbi:hypothetical protein CMQ_7401 [Grosmannia clavigera kw1407]|uniref:Rhodopsin domain-containing protein n=1 Tax=Grosmannia clavigera (strain kw1407 / UAMH 11150) TaxID=655863 RepID=F0XPG3_GROCL|nr:uncharacterized protein CMQ_7401 [Grosmannia clavigera kw1407]EFX00399.1 hypothetical protein CMQ_7401 [Grosmannia clavigera kw1407]